MACLGNTSRFCTRVQPEKLCQIILNNNNNRGIIFHKQSTTKYQQQSSFTTAAQIFQSSSSSSSSVAGYHHLINNKNQNNNQQQNHLNTNGTGFSIRKFSTKSKSLTSSRLPTRTSEQNNENKNNNNKNNNNSIRDYSSIHTQQPAGPVREIQIDPYSLMDDELKFFYDDIRKYIRIGTNQQELEIIASYYFDGQGKALRPVVALLMARAINYHLNTESRNLLSKQRIVAIFAEMLHSASLVHDDVIDQSGFRRGKPSVNALWNHKKVAMAGDYILAIASILLARIKNAEVTITLSQISTDLVQGEFMQLGAKETENERFAHYLSKTYRKTASLIANSLKAVAILSGAEDDIIDIAFQYGRNIGLAFQLVDDMLDFVSSSEAMGKPTAADLKLGLATAPVLFACEKYPELNPMIMRRFQEPGDVERAFELVHKSQGLEQTKFLARKHCIEAIRLTQELTESPYQKGLSVVSDLVINRIK